MPSSEGLGGDILVAASILEPMEVVDDGFAVAVDCSIGFAPGQRLRNRTQLSPVARLYGRSKWAAISNRILNSPVHYAPPRLGQSSVFG